MSINIFPDLGLFLFLAMFLFLLHHFVFRSLKNKGSQKVPKDVPTNWPFIGMLPWLLLNFNRVHDSFTEMLEKRGGTFEFKSPWFPDMDMLVTSNPANIHYIFSRNFSNFRHGPSFEEIFDGLGDGIFNSESKMWEAQRRTALSFINHCSFHKFLMSTTCNKLESGLVPIIHDFSVSGKVFDLQYLMQRFTFDTGCMLILGVDPNSLFSDSHEIEAYSDFTEAIFYRHVVPKLLWKTHKWLHIGTEKRYSVARENIIQFIARCITLKRELKGDQDDLLVNYLKIESAEIVTGNAVDQGENKGIPESLLVDILLNFQFAGREAVSSGITWLFWLLASNPCEQDRIHEEIIANLSTFVEKDKQLGNDNGVTTTRTLLDFFTGDGAKERISRLSYLHGAVCESLRLFPPVAINHRAAYEDDVLPSGDKVKKNTKILLSFYSMGRTMSIWGDDCLEFKPARWIRESTGRIKQEPSYKFSAFNGGPRSCVGKEVSIIQLKMVVATIIHGYHIEVVEGQPPVSLSKSGVPSQNQLVLRGVAQDLIY